MNFTDNMGDSSATQHVDKEWRFHDVPLSPYFFGHKLKVRWDLKSDEGLQFGGWQLDDVCIVANPNAICGDAVKTSTEQCDNGAMNADMPDVCRTDCRLPTCGDYITDSNEECDDGSAGSPTCSDKCANIALDNGGCCSIGGGQGSVGLSLLVGILLRRRRRA
jgi:MYXO-CTERM domain-containing protein